MSLDHPVVITCSISGTIANREQCPAIPYTPAEYAAEARRIIDVYIAAGNDMVDDVIDPRETRATICRGLEMAAGKKIERPWKRSGVVPV